MRRKSRQQSLVQQHEEGNSSDEEDLESLHNELTAIDNQIKNMTLEKNDKIQTQNVDKETESGGGDLCFYLFSSFQLHSVKSAPKLLVF